MPINSVCWDIFFIYVTDPSLLKKSISWMEKYVLKVESNDRAFIDTYADLLHKAGRTAEAISWEEKAVKLRPNNKEFANVLAKMKASEMTW